MPAKSLVSKQKAAATQDYYRVTTRGRNGDPEAYTKTPHQYGDYLIAHGKLGGSLQRDCVYWIQRYTWGMSKRPEWAKLSLATLARLCQSWDDGKLRPAERKSIAIALADLEKRGIIESRDRKGCGATVVKMYKLTPDKWKAAPPYQPPTAKQLEDAAAEVEETEEEPEAAELAEEAERTVQPGKSSKPQTLAVAISAGSAPVKIAMVYHSECPFPLIFRARTGSNGRVQVTARPSEIKAKHCSHAQLQSFANHSPSSEDSKRLIDFTSCLNSLTMQIWGKAADAALIAQVMEAAGSATTQTFERIVAIKFRNPESGRRHSPGLLVKLAADASAAWEAENTARKRAVSDLPAVQPITPAELEKIEERAQVREAEAKKKAAQCTGCSGTGKVPSGITGLKKNCGVCRGTGRKGNP